MGFGGFVNVATHAAMVMTKNTAERTLDRGPRLGSSLKDCGGKMRALLHVTLGAAALLVIFYAPIRASMPAPVYTDGRCKKSVGYVPRSECKLKAHIFYGWATLYLVPEEIEIAPLPTNFNRTYMPADCATMYNSIRCRYWRRVDYVTIKFEEDYA